MSAGEQLGHRDHEPGSGRFPLSLLAQDVADPANIGSLFRLADALGVEHLYLAGRTPTPPNARVHRTARATENHVPWTYSPDPLLLVRSLKNHGLWVVSLEITRDSLDIRRATLPPGRRTLLILGAEDRGVDQALLDESAQTLHIPMRGHNSSMNVAMACALAVFELTRNLSAV